MPNKRSRRRKVQHFSCPYCEQRLWRVGSRKYHLYYQGMAEIRQNLGITRKKAQFLATQSPTCADNDRWIEEFFCSQHSQIWLLLSRQPDGSITQTLARSEHWQKTDKTIDPSISNPSVSEYSYRMSRSGYIQNTYYRNQN